MKEEILSLIRERGLLLEKEVYDLFESFDDEKIAKKILDGLGKGLGEKFITKSLLNKNVKSVMESVKSLEDGNEVEKIVVKLGLSFELTRKKPVEEKTKAAEGYKIFYADTKPDKKLEVKDFTGHFRARYTQLQGILMQRRELQQNLISIGKISSDRASLAIIGIVTEKRVTKNKNLIIKFEDLTGEINALVKHDSEIFEKADELQLDDVVGVRGSGNRDLFFVYDIFFPDAFVSEKIKFDEDINIAFVSDVHCGSGRHLPRSFENFLEWISSEDEEAKKVKYIFFNGDNVDGVGIFPNQEAGLFLKSMEKQYEMLAGYLNRIPKRITIFMCPGQHDATRVAEPQPIISKKYAPQLYEIENLVLVTNPAMVKLTEREKEMKFLMYHGAAMNALVNEVKELRMGNAYDRPSLIVKHILKRRHLAPMHGVSISIVYIPNADRDPMVIDEVPDVIVTGDLHKADVGSYNGILMVSNSCWQAQTSFEETVGHHPDPCKVPLLNLKTRNVKILDFRDEGEVDEYGVWKVK
nr:hypothetical protein [uncultured archaeon]AQS34300.1 hypothetical protein [uncultured archaeon]